MHALDDTIAALASPPGTAFRGIVRISGPRTQDVIGDWLPAERVHSKLPGAARRIPAELHLTTARAPLAADIQWWPTARSYTGQPLAELHVVGSPPVLQTLLVECYRRGARPARPGEFTLRAFLAGRLDLLQAEAVLGVIDAGDHRELETALQQLAGGISHRMSAVRRDLIELLADLEAGLDFVEEHLEFVEHDEVCRRVSAAKQFVDQLRSQATGRMHSSDRLRVLLAGLPNAGKSTLFNVLAGADQALVSPVAGTTRDYLTAAWNCAGIVVELIDTAGWEDDLSPLIRNMSQMRESQLHRADLVVWCSAADLTASERRIDEMKLSEASAAGVPLLQVLTKCDVTTNAQAAGRLCLSAHGGQGLTELCLCVKAILDERAASRGQWLGSTAARCHESLQGAAFALSEAESAALGCAGDELIAAELRLALDHLGVIVGAVYTDDLLDRIFSKFCIGK